MIMLLLFVISTIGMSNILVHGKILDDDHLGLRSWLKRKLGKYKDVFDCYECTGFWCGFFMGSLLISFWNPFVLIPCAFAGSGIMHAYIILTDFLQSKTDFVIDDSHE